MRRRAPTIAAAAFVFALHAVIPLGATLAGKNSHRADASCMDASCADSELEVLVQVRRSGSRRVPDAATRADAMSEEPCEDGLCGSETESENLVQIRRSGSRLIPESMAEKQMSSVPVVETLHTEEEETKPKGHRSILLHQMTRGKTEAVVNRDGQVDAVEGAEEDLELNHSLATEDATTKTVLHDEVLMESYVNVPRQDANTFVPGMAVTTAQEQSLEEPNSGIGLTINNSETFGTPLSLLQTEQTSGPQWEPRSSRASASTYMVSVACIFLVAAVALSVAVAAVAGKKDLLSRSKTKQPKEQEAALEMQLTKATESGLSDHDSDVELPCEVSPTICEASPTIYPARLPGATASFVIPLESFTAAQQDVGYIDVHSNLMQLRACFLSPNGSPVWSALELYTLDSPWNSEALLISLHRNDADGVFQIHSRGREMASIQSSVNGLGEWMFRCVASDRTDEGPLHIGSFLGGKLIVGHRNDGSYPLLAAASRDGAREFLQLDMRLSTNKGLHEEAAMIVLSVLAVLACSGQKQVLSWATPASLPTFLSTPTQLGAPRLRADGNITSFVVPERRLTDEPGAQQQASFEVLTGPGFAPLTATLWRSKNDDAWVALELTAENQVLLSCCRLLVDSTAGASREAQRHPASQGLLIQGPHGELLGTMAPENNGNCILRRPGHSSFNIQVCPDAGLVTGAAGDALLALATEAPGGQLQLDVAAASTEAPLLLIAVLGALAFQPWSVASMN